MAAGLRHLRPLGGHLSFRFAGRPDDRGVADGNVVQHGDDELAAVGGRLRRDCVGQASPSPAAGAQKLLLPVGRGVDEPILRSARVEFPTSARRRRRSPSSACLGIPETGRAAGSPVAQSTRTRACHFVSTPMESRSRTIFVAAGVIEPDRVGARGAGDQGSDHRRERGDAPHRRPQSIAPACQVHHHTANSSVGPMTPASRRRFNLNLPAARAPSKLRASVGLRGASSADDAEARRIRVEREDRGGAAQPMAIGDLVRRRGNPIGEERIEERLIK